MGWRRLVPRSLFARVTLIIVVGLAIAQLLTFAAIRYERGMAMRELMMTASSATSPAPSPSSTACPPPSAKAGWRGWSGATTASCWAAGRGHAPDSRLSQQFATAIADAMRPFEIVKIGQVTQPPQGLQIQVRLSDGSS
jgi:hypothetical protein